jgi:hypothetical protein
MVVLPQDTYELKSADIAAIVGSVVLVLRTTKATIRAQRTHK